MKIETGNSGSVIAYKGVVPKIHPSAFICEGARIIGDVEIGEQTSVWYNVVIRGDVHYIKIGARTNIQDLSMLHVTNGKFPLNIGDEAVIGHSVSVHGATLKNNCFLGIGAIVLDGATVSSHSLVAAGALVKEGFVVPEGTLVAGVPGKIIRDLGENEIEKIKQNARNYVGYVEEYRNQSNDLRKR